MRHDWIFDMLADLQDYARRNDLPELALKAEEALAAARREIGSGAEAARLALASFRRPTH